MRPTIYENRHTKRVIQKRPIKETHKRDLQERKTIYEICMERDLLDVKALHLLKRQNINEKRPTIYKKRHTKETHSKDLKKRKTMDEICMGRGLLDVKAP